MTGPLAAGLLVRSVEDVLRIVNERAEAIGMRREDIDYRAGLTSGHAGKILAIPPVKRPDLGTILLLAGAVGYGVALVEDENALKSAKREARNRKLYRKKGLHWRNARKLRITHEDAVQRGKKGQAAYMEKTTPELRRHNARSAARARWHKPRVVEITEGIFPSSNQTDNRRTLPHPSSNKAEFPPTEAQGIRRLRSAGNGAGKSPGTARQRKRTGRRGAAPA